VFVWCAIQWTIVQDGIKDIAEGKLTEPISTDKMYFDFKTDIERLNSINEGVQIAVADQMRSERMKTELITNVSHDIKTPLTSIINYVDLLSKEMGKDEPDDEKTKEYLEVLGRQSNRLKKLIQDLIDASKATTGNIEMDIDKVNVSMLINQALGEFEDKLNNASLTVVKHGLDESAFAQADGRYLWRVFDNLLINICKYSQEKTRVYLDVEAADDVVNISFKNISKEELNVSPEELMERFTRGDSSRNTEGSGLGLSIASSLVNMMGGSMKIDIDGDLFKVNVELKK
jgi:signal transduction histidine kinase